MQRSVGTDRLHKITVREREKFQESDYLVTQTNPQK